MQFGLFGTAVSIAALALAGTPTMAASLITNGGFENLTNGIGQLGYNTDATGWSTTGYNFVFDGSTADSAGSNGVYGNLQLWGPNNGSANGLGPSPNGGNFVGADGAFGVAPIEQIVNGLTIGQSYRVGFYWAGAQQYQFNGANTEQWEVSLGGGPSQFTAIYNNPDHGFSGWYHENFTFTANGTSAVLSFLAHGTPNGVPPFSLLDGVTMSAAVPEPATWGMMLLGLGAAGGVMRLRRRAALRHA